MLNCPFSGSRFVGHLCNMFHIEIDSPLACVVCGQSVTGEVIAQVKKLSAILLSSFAFHSGSSHYWMKVIIPDLRGTMWPQ